MEAGDVAGHLPVVLGIPDHLPVLETSLGEHLIEAVDELLGDLVEAVHDVILALLQRGDECLAFLRGLQFLGLCLRLDAGKVYANRGRFRKEKREM